jgi:alpha-N-arabinofuranosidase
MILTPTYYVMEMYNVHQDALMIPITLNSNDYVLNGKKLKAVSASASKDKNGAVHISLVNIDADNSQDINIDLGSLQVKKVTGTILRSGKLQDHNTFDDPNKIKLETFSDAKLNGSNLEVKLPPFSVVVLELK